MSTQNRSEAGRFASKSAAPREVRSIRLTDTTWEKLGELAGLRCITRADLIEQLIESGALERPTSSGVSLQQVDSAIARTLSDPAVTRNGKDKGSVRRALEALRNYLS